MCASGARFLEVSLPMHCGTVHSISSEKERPSFDPTQQSLAESDGNSVPWQLGSEKHSCEEPVTVMDSRTGQ